MSDFSSLCHHHPIDASHAGEMIVDDVLPAAAFLTGDQATDVLAAAVAATGRELAWCHPNHVQYRPHSDLVVRYRCGIRDGGEESTDTILAATTVGGPPPGTVPVEATTEDGSELSIGVWRWPFDPVLTDLTAMVTPGTAADRLGGLVCDTARFEVVAYRPTERAVVRVEDDGRELYVKVVPAATTGALVDRHRRLRDAGLPVPVVLAHGDGWIAMQALAGTTLRERMKQGLKPWPPADRVRDLLTALVSVDLTGIEPVRSRLHDAPAHAAMVASVLPEATDRLDRISEHFLAARDDVQVGPTTHGDLHEAQLIVDDDGITGLLDIDDVGPGDPLDDVATLVGHLQFRAATSGVAGGEVSAYADALRRDLTANHDPVAVDLRIAAVLTGLATGPFRIQQAAWQTTTLELVDRIEDLVGVR